jgi:hypothetical protein
MDARKNLAVTVVVYDAINVGAEVAACDEG